MIKAKILRFAERGQTGVRKRYRLISFLLFLVFVFCACIGEQKPLPANSSGIDISTDPELTDAPGLDLRAYTLILPIGSADELTDACDAFYRTLTARGAAPAAYRDDLLIPGVSEEDPCEILIGSTNRAQSQEAAAGLVEDEFTIRIVDAKLVIAGGSDAAVIAALDYFVDAVLPADSAVIALPEAITLRAGLPAPGPDVTPGPDDPDAPELPADPLHPLSGLTVYSLGDSYFTGKELPQQEVWVNRLAAAYGWDYTSYSRGGCTVSDYPSGRNPMVSRLDALDASRAGKVDLILFEGGTNDRGERVPFGSLDSTDTKTFSGAVNATVSYLLDTFPNATVVCISPFNYENPGSEANGYVGTIADYAEKFCETVAHSFGDHPRVALFRACDPSVSGVDMNSADFRRSYCEAENDASHLNREGMLLMQRAMEPFLTDLFEVRYGELEDLRVLAIGDSLFAGDDLGRDGVWLQLLAGKYGWDFQNAGINGSTVSNYVTNRAPMVDRWATELSREDPETVDLIFLEGGPNDCGQGAPLGEVGSLDSATFAGAWNRMVQGLLETYPNAVIVFVTPWKLTGGSPYGYTEYAECIIACYEQLYAGHPRVRLLDAGDSGVSGVDMNSAAFRELYSLAPNDRFHLNAQGMERLARRLEPPLAGLLADAPAEQA